MIVQACLNGSRTSDFHPGVPIGIDDLVRSAIEAVQAGASELHFHVHDDEGIESLQPGPVHQTVQAVRSALPGTLFGISSGAWIEGDLERTLTAISSWTLVPDYASVNMSEPGADQVIEALLAKGVGIEAGIGTVADAKSLITQGVVSRCLRVLVEMDQPGVQEARTEAEAILSLLNADETRKPILLHGFDETKWEFVTMAWEGGYSTRVGFEDGGVLPDGRTATSNANLVSAAFEIRRTTSR